ncbi:MAG: hypothetical protein J1F23_03355 [Oscillospiraceae bacterium]|nr:hypothetical protein [Oscillospiraceae bacterium]
MKVLVLSSTPWSNDNSFGLSYNNIFDGIDDLRFASVYCNPGQPSNKFDMVCFQITFETLIKNLKNPKISTGKVVIPNKSEGTERNIKEQNTFDTARKLRWQVLFWARDFIWKIGRWNSPELRKFLDDFKPDLIFQPVYFSSYLSDVALFIKEYTGSPMVGYISDDNYTLRQFRFSPLYWIDRLYKRRKVKKVIENCDILYVISQIQKEEYEKIFTPPCKILTKCADFSEPAPEWTVPKGKIKMLYTGNLGVDRWKSLALISDAVERLNAEGQKIELDIYSATPLTEKMKRSLSKNGSHIHPPVSYETVQTLQREADVLVHIEGLSLKSRMAVHQSFSTKLVDYFNLGKCIFAVGKDDEASVKHLIDNDAAVVAQSAVEVYQNLKDLCENREQIANYGKKAYECGAKHHDKTTMQTMLREDLKAVCEDKG